MIPVAIPAWTAEGVLPPINVAQPVSPERSPYLVSLTDYIPSLGDTPERRAILDGFATALRFRNWGSGHRSIPGFIDRCGNTPDGGAG